MCDSGSDCLPLLLLIYISRSGRPPGGVAMRDTTSLRRSSRSSSRSGALFSALLPNLCDWEWDYLGSSKNLLASGRGLARDVMLLMFS
jgi:hypothetical protein